MITGDHLLTGMQIAKECHILEEGDDMISLEGSDVNEIIDRFKILDTYKLRSSQVRELLETNKLSDVFEKVSYMVELSPEELEGIGEGMDIMQRLRVIARATPKHKDAIVRWYMEYDCAVAAVTGDGANDALALKQASVGLAMGISGTQVAKEACDIVILDDNFKSIVSAVMWGRSVFDNIRKFVQFQLTVNVCALSISVIAAAAGTELPFYAVQFLWLNLVMDTFGALALATELPTMDLLDRNPYPKSESLISRHMVHFIGVHSMYQLGILLTFLFIDMEELLGHYKDPDKDESVVQTVIFNTFVWFQIFNQFNARRVNGEGNICHNICGSMNFIGLTILIIIIQVTMVQLNPLGFFKTKMLPVDIYMMCVGVAATEVILGPLVPTIGVIIGDCILGFLNCIEGCLEGPARCLIEICYEDFGSIFPEEIDMSSVKITLKSEYEIAHEQTMQTRLMEMETEEKESDENLSEMEESDNHDI